MPIYEYQCDACGKRMELLQKISDAPARECPECGNESLRRLVSAAAFHLKGSGWYATDFRNAGRGDDTASGKSGGSESGAPDKNDGKKTKARVDKTASSDKDG